MADHSQVEQADAMVRSQENVAGVRIGVEYAIDEDLLQIGAEKFFGKCEAVEIEAGQGTQFGDFYAFDVIHRQHFVSR